jgi:pimeloyl-ACP methyl ester carboxylesterase
MTSGRRTVRRHGRAPYTVVVVHGGPGAPGSAAGLARAISSTRGVLEPWQSARSVDALVEELRDQVDRDATVPVVLIGHSWGAWLALLFAARFPDRVRRLVLVGCPPFSARDARAVRRARRERLGPSGWREFRATERRLSPGQGGGRTQDLRRLGELSEVADSIELRFPDSSVTRLDPKAYRVVWSEASELRRTGGLLRRVRGVTAPILLLHGRDDPHPSQSVVRTLRRLGLPVRVVLLERCGHEPWRERYGRGPLLRALRRELTLP